MANTEEDVGLLSLGLKNNNSNCLLLISIGGNYLPGTRKKYAPTATHICKNLYMSMYDTFQK